VISLVLSSSPTLSSLVRGIGITRVVLAAARNRAEPISRWLCANRVLVLLSALRATSQVAAARQLLASVRCRAVVTINEQIAPASHLTVAAREMGIRTYQALHGTPTTTYWPFVSDETWVWGRTTHEAFIRYGADPETVPIVGNLELSYWYRHSAIRWTNQMGTGTTGGRHPQKCLFLSQLSGASHWGSTAFEEPVDWLARALGKQPGNWMLNIRLHPNDSAAMASYLMDRFRFLGERLAFSDAHRSLTDDIADSTVVCTGSSTGAAIAFGLGKPALLMWNHEMTRIHGEPFLPSSHVARNAEELLHLLEEVDALAPTKEGVGNVVANSVDASQVAAQHLLEDLERRR
jgi:hypothetical protein